VPFRDSSDDIDLDATVERMAEHPGAPDVTVMVRDRVDHRRAVVFAVDVSGSMRGERVRTAAATVGALVGELRRDQLAVVAFWSDAALLLRLGDPVQPAEVIDALLRVPSGGLTNVSFPLELAAQQLMTSTCADTRVILLSDCVHNAGPDPRPAAAALPRLDILVDVSGEHDLELARQLARAGKGSFHRIRSHRDVAPALDAAFAG
jgi:Mg-chelatase subunit ChlD